jgi:hypothetical protein
MEVENLLQGMDQAHWKISSSEAIVSFFKGYEDLDDQTVTDQPASETGELSDEADALEVESEGELSLSENNPSETDQLDQNRSANLHHSTLETFESLIQMPFFATQMFKLPLAAGIYYQCVQLEYSKKILNQALLKLLPPILKDMTVEDFAHVLLSLIDAQISLALASKQTSRQDGALPPFHLKYIGIRKEFIQALARELDKEYSALQKMNMKFAFFTGFLWDKLPQHSKYQEIFLDNAREYLQFMGQDRSKIYLAVLFLAGLFNKIKYQEEKVLNIKSYKRVGGAINGTIESPDQLVQIANYIYSILIKFYLKDQRNLISLRSRTNSDARLPPESRTLKEYLLSYLWQFLENFLNSKEQIDIDLATISFYEGFYFAKAVVAPPTPLDPSLEGN